MICIHTLVTSTVLQISPNWFFNCRESLKWDSMVAQNLLIHLPRVKTEPCEPFQGFLLGHSWPSPAAETLIIIFNCVIKLCNSLILTPVQRKNSRQRKDLSSEYEYCLWAHWEILGNNKKLGLWCIENLNGVLSENEGQSLYVKPDSLKYFSKVYTINYWGLISNNWSKRISNRQ